MSLLHLVGHDGTDHGDDALALARSSGTGQDVRRLIVHVLFHLDSTVEATEPAIAELGQAERTCVAAARKGVADDEQFKVVFARSPALGLRACAEQYRADLVALGDRHQSFTPLHIPVSTVAGRLLSRGPCAVAVAPDGYARAWSIPGKIIVGVDGSKEARAALAEAAALFGHSGATIDTVCVFATAGEADDAQRIADEALKALPEGERGEGCACPGSPGEVIVTFASGVAP